MIELNCSYGESKKILDLGYDFSKVCTKFKYESPTIGFTPIVPKAALEACLPDYTRYESKFTWAGHTSISLHYGTGEDLTIENYTTEYESAFEAFIWVHENYPEELKKRFEEVMG